MNLSDSAPTLRLLGGAVIQVGDAPLGGAAAHRHRLALLALLATGGRLMSRDKIVAYLWPERDTEPARNLLKTAVHELRKLFGENVIRSTGDQLSVDPAVLRCDVLEFEEAVAAKDFAKAASLYGGPFLDGFFLKDASEFEHWTDGQRTRLADAYARAIEQLPPDAVPSVRTLAAAATALATRARVRRWPVLVASVLGLGVVVALAAANGRDRPAGAGTQAAVAAAILPDDQPGTALGFNGTNANASTPAGTLITEQLDNVAVDLWVRYDGPTSHEYQMLFYNGHGSVTGWGIMVLGAADHVQDGTIGIIAGGLTVTSTPLVLKVGQWQHLNVERQDERLTVTLDDRSFSTGKFPVNPVAGARFRAIERTTLGGDGSYDHPKGNFRGVVDRLRIRDLVSGYSVDRWEFDEGKGPIAVGQKGAILQIGSAQWTPAERLEPRDVFWTRLERLCGQSYAGHLTEGQPGDSLVRRAAPIMHVRSCTPAEIRIALHVGADRSRTWVLSRTARGLWLKHEHRHADGSFDRITNYGGETRDSGSFGRQDFHADAYTATLVPTAKTNVWTMEIELEKVFAYSLRRADRHFRLEFDLTRTVARPPPPWGSPP